jgi:hypothetical protein
MKKLSLVLLLLPLFLSCKKDEPVVEGNDVEQNTDWTAEKFKADYTIQFPGYYSGGFIQGFEGGTFKKTRDNKEAVFSYEFSNGLQTFDFGETLADEATDSIAVEDGDILMFLPNRIDFTKDGEIVGILFYNTLSPIRRAELYWKDGGVFKDALMINYNEKWHDEMIAIVKTIQHI